ncbi:MAG: DUF4233 domain-containing protein [Mobilicoccus sp.]|nr:DUF4233 domain-containing protein [Mobilicoccus sp.]
MSALPFYGDLGPMQRRLATVVLAGQTPVLFFGALTFWGLAQASRHPNQGLILGLGCALAVFAIIAAAMMRRPFGVTLGWLVQAFTLAAALLAPVAVLVGVIFGGLWVTALHQGAKMDALTREHLRAQQAP